jgi:hypothetical protein
MMLVSFSNFATGQEVVKGEFASRKADEDLPLLIRLKKTQR